eukprot:maker-scaffold606_size125303-snap-gene-0.17 protein:Tk03637 transcript:maker-scaffold606_size125303-snap-gene-0.17-mRNA-1 annotation:"phospholipase a2 isozymes pa3a pa3b pa5"
MMCLRLCLIFSLGLSPLVQARMEESFVRVQKEPDLTKYVTLMDFQRIVNLHLNEEGQILDCQVTKREDLAMEMLKIEFDNPGPSPNVEYLMMDLDVAKYGRICSKHIRDLGRRNDRSDPIVKRLLELESIRKGYPGTKFCTATTSKFNAKLQFDDLTAVDECCKDLMLCPSQMQQFSLMFYYFNVYPHRLYSCPCVAKFRDCLATLEKEGDRDAQEVNRLMFDVAQMKCITKDSINSCTKYDEWFTQCEESEEIVIFAATSIDGDVLYTV